jgi:hypothetical protein
MSLQHFFLANEQNENLFYHLMEYKIPKPFLLKPIKITVGNPLNDTYYMVKNIVYRKKQILALKREEDQNTIILVEAKIADGQLKYLSMLSDEVLNKVSKIVASSIH